MMRHLGKRVFALFLALMLCLSLFPSALGEEAEGSITPVEEESTLPEETEAEGTIAPAEPGAIAPAGDEQQDAATSGTCGENLSWTLDENGTLTISGSGSMANWSSNGAPWYASRESIRSVVIRSGVTTIGKNAFRDCTNLSAVSIPRGVTSVGSWAFQDCTALPSVTLPEGFTFLGYYAFCRCTSLTEVTIPASMTKIGQELSPDQGVFIACDSLRDIWFGGSVEAWKALGPVADRYLVTVHCSDGEIIGADPTYCGDDLIWNLSSDGVFTVAGSGDMWDFDNFADPWYGNSEIKTLRILPGVTSIGNWAFERCANLSAITIPATVSRIGHHAFHYCQSLTALSLPAGVRTIEDSAFSGCSSLTTVTLPESVTDLGYGVFDSCSSLTQIFLPGSLEHVESQNFNSCTSLTDVYYGGTMAAWQQLDVTYDRYRVNIHCSDGDIPHAETSDCGDNLIWNLSSDGVLSVAGSGDMWDYSYGTSPWYDRRTEIRAVRLLSGVTSIGDYAFYNCSNLSQMNIPDGLTRIGTYAFSRCESLTEVEIPASLVEGAEGAFSGCKSLQTIRVAQGNPVYASRDGVLYDKEITELYIYPSGKSGNFVIPEGVTVIGESAFSDCGGLTAVTIPEGVTDIKGWAFLSCTGLTSVTIPASVTAMEYCAFGSCLALREIRFLGAAPTVIWNAFYGDTATAYYPQADSSWTDAVRQSCGGTITWVGYGPVATGQCGDDLTWSLDADGTLTISGTGEMWNWIRTEYAWPSTPWQAMVSRISSVRIEPGVTDIGDYAFYGCQSMTEISIAETVTRIGAGAFCACSGLLSLTIPEGVTGIGERAFNSCYSMTNIRLPASLSQIGDQLLSSCTGLTDVYYGGTMAEWKDLDADYDPYKVTVHCADGDLSPADTAYCGDNLIWSLSSSGTLTIAGSGDMWDFGYGQAPWDSRSGEIKQLRLMSGVTSIGNYAFSNCRQLSSVTLPEGLIRVGDDAFAGCESLLVLTLPDTVTSIGRSAFYQTSLYSFVIPEGVTSIENSTFCACPYLTTVVIPETVTEIGETAFYNCFELSEVTIPEGVTSLGYAAFCACSSLESITIPAGVTDIGEAAFSGCSSLTSISVDSANANYASDDGVLFNKDKTVLLKCPEGKSGDYSIPETVKEIKSSAFSNCEKLISVTIRSGVTSIQDGFFRCSSLERIDVAPDNANYSSDDGVLFNKDKSVLLRYPGGKSGKYSIPMGVKEINLGAFRFCEQLTGVTIPASVNRIGFLAFANDSGLREIYFRGSAPVFVGNTEDGAQYQFGGVTATAYYPAGDPSWTESVRQNYGGRITWVAYEPGDLNGDCQVDSLDLMLLRKQLVGLPAEGAFNPAAADLNGDGTVDILDLVRLRKLLA